MTRPSGPSTESRVQTLLREAGPLSVDEIVARLMAEQPLASKNPKNAVRNALSMSDACAITGDGRYCYLPTFVRGAAVRLTLEMAAPESGLLVTGVEVSALLWPLPQWQTPGRDVTLILAGGPEVVVEGGVSGWISGTRFPFALPPEFWSWWQAQQEAGADAMELRCEDGETGRYAVTAASIASLDPTAVAARNAELREAVVAILKRAKRASAADVARRLLARGMYHRRPAPDPLYQVLFAPLGAFAFEVWNIVHRPDLTPAMSRVFGSRIEVALAMEDDLMQEHLHGAAQGQEREAEEEGEEVEVEPPLAAPEPATVGYRLKVSLEGYRDVWRAIEILDNQTFADLHDAIQDAFNWDNDHLYAFFLSGRPWDALTEIAHPDAEAEPPDAEEITLAELELQAKQRFLYIFDFGDEWRHQIEVTGTFPAPGDGEFPRIVESHGQAPPQYPGWDYAEEEEEEEE